MKALVLVFVMVILCPGADQSLADKAPIVGTIKAVDATGRTLTVTSTARGKTRDVVIDVKPGTKIVRPAGAGAAAAEQASSLTDLKTGWTVTIVTRHEGRREVADMVRVDREH